VSFDPEEFGRRLAAARARAGLKPKQLAAALGSSVEKVNRWERGELVRPPSKGDLRLLADLLDQDAGWLLSGDGALRHPERDIEDADLAAQRHDAIMARLEGQDEVLRLIQVTTDEIRSRLE
jgi:transcriptional regulator with XRE-family HTH domain